MLILVAGAVPPYHDYHLLYKYYNRDVNAGVCVVRVGKRGYRVT